MPTRRLKKKKARVQGSITHIKRLPNGFSFRQFGCTINVTHSDDLVDGVVDVIAVDSKGKQVFAQVTLAAAMTVAAIGQAIDKARELGKAT